MRNFLSKGTKKPIDIQIDAVYEEMRQMGVDSAEYPQLLDTLERLHKLKITGGRGRVSNETIVLSAVNLLGIFIIVVAEQTHMMNSKALNHIKRP